MLGVGAEDRYFLVRLVSLTAHHDIGESGLSTAQAKQIVNRLSQHGRVFISAETTVDESLSSYLLRAPADRIFDVLAYADIIVGDSQTMTIEAAVLGTPSLRCNTFVGRLTVPAELEERYGLTFGFVPQNFRTLLSKLDEWLAEEGLQERWQARREAMLAESVDVTEWILDKFYKLSLRS